MPITLKGMPTPHDPPLVSISSFTYHMPVLVGSMTPTAIWTAAKAGAEYVKVFRAGTLGPGYIVGLDVLYSF